MNPTISVVRRLAPVLFLAAGLLPAHALEPSAATAHGIAVERKHPESERTLTLTNENVIILHLRNDTEGIVIFQAVAGDCTSGKAVVRSEHVLVDPLKQDAVTPLVSWLMRGFVFHREGLGPVMVYVAKPGDEFDVVIELTALRDAKDPKSPRRPLMKGTYRVSLDLYRAEDMAKMPETGMPAEPLLTYVIQVK